MGISTTNTKDEYVGNGVVTNYPITFDYVDVSTIKPTVDNVIESYTFDNVLTPTTVIFDVPPANGAAVLIQRETPLVQETDLDESQEFGAQAENIEAQFDRLVTMVQEVEAGATVVQPVESSSAVWEEWAPNTDYVKNQLLRDGPAGLYYSVVADYTSNLIDIETDVTAGRLELFNQGEQGEQGPKGDQGPVGPAGANGANGANGADGADGVFAEIASQLEAETGTDNVKGMTPLRVQQSIDFNLQDYYTMTQVDTKNDSQDLEISQLKQRMTTVENNLEVNQFDGKQRIKNNEAVPEELLGRDADVAEEGFGDQFWLNANGAEFARINCLIKRRDDLEERFVNVTLVMHYISGVWYIGRESTVVLNDGEPDGLVFSVDTNGAVGTVRYTSDNMAGGNYEGEIYWQGKEIPATIDGLVD